jgi:hypothetical protein
MTPLEVQWRLEAEYDREHRAKEQTAQLACWVLTPLIGKTLQVRDLVAPRGPQIVDWSVLIKG